MRLAIEVIHSLFHLTFQHDVVIELLLVCLDKFLLLLGAFLAITFQSLTKCPMWHALRILEGAHIVTHDAAILEGTVIEVAIAIQKLLLLLGQLHTTLLLLHDVTYCIGILVQVDGCFVLVGQTFAHTIFLPCLGIDIIQVLLQGIGMVGVFVSGSEIERLFVVKAFLSLLGFIV